MTYNFKEPTNRGHSIEKFPGTLPICRRVAVCWCVAVCCKMWQCVALRCSVCSVLQCIAVCCSVLQYVAVCCSVLQCVAVCCSVLCSKESAILHRVAPVASVASVASVAVSCNLLYEKGSQKKRSKKKRDPPATRPMKITVQETRPQNEKEPLKEALQMKRTHKRDP